MPAVSEKQKRFMQAVAHNKAFAKKVGVPQSVGKEFSKSGGGEVKKESKAMAKKEVSFMQKKGAPKSMVKHVEAEMKGMKHGGKTKKMAAGGLAAFKEGGKTGRPKARPLMGKGLYDFMGSQDSMPTLASVEKNFAKGGRFLEGDGDGMSDDIPAVIAGREPARLADGEFVIPADVVSHLGNGSSKAGAKRLHDMMNRIRKERTGREKQAPAVKAEKYMPA